MESYDECLGHGDIREPGEGPGIPDAVWDSKIWRDYDYYEPTPMLDLIGREGWIHVARIEWRGQHPTLGLHAHRDMKGSALVFDQETQLLLHELCFEYDVLPAAPEFGYCHKLQTPESE